jgi:hypothetical protein
MVINEIGPRAAANGLVELRATNSGDVGALRIVNETASATVIGGFNGGFPLNAGDLIVVHFGGVGFPGGVTDEWNGTKTSCGTASCYPNAWDRLSSGTIPSGSAVLALTDADPGLPNPMLDAVALVNGTPTADFINGLTAVSGIGNWTACPNTCAPADASSVSVDWSSVGSDASGMTIQRDFPAGGGADTNGSADWSLKPSTLGLPNTP